MRKGQTNTRFGLTVYPKKPLIIAHSGVSRATRCLKVVRSLLHLAYFVYARSESPGEVMHTCWLVGAFAPRRCYKNHFLCWQIYSIIFFIVDHLFYFLIQYIIWNLKFGNIVRAHISRLASLLVIQINSRCPFLTMGSKLLRYTGIFTGE